MTGGAGILEPLTAWIGEAGRGLLDLLYPPRCVVCREPGPERFCSACRGAILPVELPRRPGSRLAGRACVGAYAGPLREAVLYLKYHDRRGLARDLGVLLADCLEAQRGEWQPEALVPVPIHPQRRRERGYNQSELLAAVVAERCGLLMRDALDRIRDTQPQTNLTGRDRRENVRGSMAPSGRASPGRRVVLIDDVYTTGTTIEEAAKNLLVAGAHTVYALTLCG
jgi:ComF family protein